MAVNDVPTYQCLVLATDGAFETSGGLRAMLPTTLPGGTLGFAGVPPTRADPGQAVTLSPRRVRFSGVPRRRSTATCGHDVGQAGRVRMAPVHLAAGPPTYTGAVNTLKRRAADAGVKASISTGCATPLLCAGCAARHRNRPTRPRRVDVQRMPRWRAAPLRQLHRSGRHALNDRRIACRRCGVSVWRRDVGCRPGLFDL